MVEKKLNQICSMTTLSQEDSWAKVYATLKDTTEEIKIDFTNVIISRPLTFPSFRLLLQMPNIHMKFTNEQEIVESIQSWLILNAKNDQVDRIEHVVIEHEPEKTPDQLKIESYGNRVYDRFDIDGDMATYKVKKFISTISNTTTIEYMRFAVNRLMAENCIKKFRIDLRDIVINGVDALETLAKLKDDVETAGAEFEIFMNDTETIKTMQLCLNKISNEYKSVVDRLKYIKKFKGDKHDIPGLLIKYRDSRATDTFGRSGKGEVEWCRIAIFRGIRKGGQLVFCTFFEDRFYTKVHWSSQHDGEKHPGLKTETKTIDATELGFLNRFLGSRYHFIKAVQKSKAENKKMIVDLSESGTNIFKDCTIPERIKVVLDDWGVKYDAETLGNYIEETKEKLKDE